MRLRSFNLRTYLIFSYLALILLLTVGMWGVYDRASDVLLDRSLETTEAALKDATAGSVKASEKILTAVGEYIVKDKAQDAVRELHYVLPKKGPYNYAQLRRNQKLRRIAVQAIQTPRGPVGYTDLYDTKGEIIFHPDRGAEGQNQLVFRSHHPDALALLQRSFKEDVSGYYTSRDEQQRDRKRFAVRLHVPGTPFIVGAVVNIDEFFLPTQQRLQAFGKEISAKSIKVVREQEQALDSQVRNGIIIAGLALCLLGGLGGLWFAAVISRPLRRLEHGVQQVGEGNFAVEVPEQGFREVAELAVAFNQLGAKLTEYIEKRDFIRDTFGRYVTQEVVKRLLESEEALEMGGEIREVSLLMSDLRGFTALTADMEPEDVITFLNRYLSKMIEILLEYHAVIDEILGDGILAFFGAPEPLEDHPVRAVACAMAMQAAMDEINFLNEAEGLPHLEMGLAVNTGAVVVGNIGSERRTKYSVVGAHVNLTSRIESFALGGQVLISADTYARVKDLVEVGNILEADMKGIPGKVTLYEVHAIAGPYNIQLKPRRDALVPLAEPFRIHLQRIREKVIIGTNEAVWVTHLSETAVGVALEGELVAWEDVRLRLLDEKGAELHGRIYGKVTKVEPRADGGLAATIRFTSVAPEIHLIIHQTLNRMLPKEEEAIQTQPSGQDGVVR